MHDVASPQVRRILRSSFGRGRLVLLLLALVVAAGLVAIGRWTAPTTPTVPRTRERRRGPGALRHDRA